MRKALFTLMILAVCVVVAGCASKHMQQISPPSDGADLSESKSAVVFFRDTSFGGAIQAPIVRVAQGDIQLVGISSANTKFIHTTTPGRHIYAIVSGESSNILDADLAPGKYHYVRVSPRLGIMMAGFKFEPLTAAEAESAKESSSIAGCKLMGLNADSSLWFSENKPKMLTRISAAVKQGDTSGEPGKAVIAPAHGVSRFR